MKYNKLVRDKIPEIIKAKGGTCKTHVANELEYSQKLKEKLGEEIAEFIESEEISELADILEVMYAIYEAKKLTKEEVEQIRAEKAEKRGSFSKKLILEESEDAS